MYTGTLIKDLLSAVEKAEEVAAARIREATHPLIESDLNYAGRELEPEKFAESLGLSAADRDLSLFLVVHS